MSHCNAFPEEYLQKYEYHFGDLGFALMFANLWFTGATRVTYSK